MRRSGSWKSSSATEAVARELGRILDAPVTHLDAIYFDDEWTPLPAETFESVQLELVAEPRWIIVLWSCRHETTFLGRPDFGKVVGRDS